MEKYKLKNNLIQRMLLKNDYEKILFGIKIKKQYQSLSEEEKNEVSEEIKFFTEKLKQQTNLLLEGKNFVELDF